MTSPMNTELAPILEAPYAPSWSCSDDEPLQRALNALYDYAGDVETKVLHRSRLNLFDTIARRLVSRRRFPAMRRALDLGCNAGYYTKMISDLGFESTLGLDIEPEFIGRARTHLASDHPGRRREFRVANAEELDEPGAYDFILCTEVIEHTSRPDRVVANIAAALAPGGVAVVTLPNGASMPYLWARLAHALKGKPIDPVLRDHLSYPFHRALHLFDGRGMRVIETHGTNLLLVGPVIQVLHGRPGFGALHHGNAALSRVWPLKYVSQFFFMVLQRSLARPTR